MKTKTKRKRGLAVALATVLILALLLLFDYANGDPISQKWAEHCALAYAQKLYPGQTFVITSSTGSQFVYGMKLQSAESADTYFYVDNRYWFVTEDTTMRGKPTTEHAYRIDERHNTLNRLQMELRDLAIAAIKTSNVGWTLNDEEQVDVELFYNEERESYADVLQLDQPLDLAMLKTTPTLLSLDLFQKTDPTDDEVQQALCRLKQIMENANMPFTHYSVTLYQIDENGNADMDQYKTSGVVSATEIDTQSNA